MTSTHSSSLVRQRIIVAGGNKKDTDICSKTTNLWSFKLIVAVSTKKPWNSDTFALAADIIIPRYIMHAKTLIGWIAESQKRVEMLLILFYGSLIL